MKKQKQKQKWFYSKKVQEGILSLVTGILIGASSASMSSRAADDCIERTDLIGITVIQQSHIKGTRGCTIKVKAKGASIWAKVYSPVGKKLVRFEGLNHSGKLVIQKEDGSKDQIDPETFEFVSQS